MTGSINRREFLAQHRRRGRGPRRRARPRRARHAGDQLFKISLAQWSLHRAFFGRGGKKLDPLDFAKIAKNDYGIDAVEYVNQFYKDKTNDDAYLTDLKKRGRRQRASRAS